jgi:hypothetical protein
LEELADHLDHNRVIAVPWIVNISFEFAVLGPRDLLRSETADRARNLWIVAAVENELGTRIVGSTPRMSISAFIRRNAESAPGLTLSRMRRIAISTQPVSSAMFPASGRNCSRQYSTSTKRRSVPH